MLIAARRPEPPRRSVRAPRSGSVRVATGGGVSKGPRAAVGGGGEVGPGGGSGGRMCARTPPLLIIHGLIIP